MDEDEILFWLINSILLFLIVCSCGIIVIVMYVKRLETVCILTGSNMINNVSYIQHIDSLRENGLIY